MKQYLGPVHRTVELSDWDQIVEAASGGLLNESQWCELKVMPTPPGAEKKADANIEMARDLASLSVDGGVLIYGIKDQTLEVTGCDITGLEDRVSQVASSRVSPRLSPIIHPPVPNPDNLGKHVLVVQIPPSPDAPHMVDGNYWGRSSNGKDKLSDAEVRRLMDARQFNEKQFEQRLLSLVENDPLAPYVTDYPTGQAHIYLLALPCGPTAGRSIDSNQLYGAAKAAAHLDPKDQAGPLSWLTTPAADPLGVALQAGSSPAGLRDECTLCYLLVHQEDFAVEVVSGGGSAFREREGRGKQNNILGNTILVATRQFLHLVRNLSEEWGYMGLWRIGVHIEPLRGAVWGVRELGSYETPFSRDWVTSHKVEEPSSWSADAKEETIRILEGLLRGVGRAGWTYDNLMSR